MLAALVLALAPQDLVQISGRVLLTDGTPLAGAALLMTPADGPDAWPTSRLGTSALDGSFRFEMSPDALRRLPVLVALSEAGVGVAAPEAGTPLVIEVAAARPLALTLVDGERVLAHRKVRLHPVETSLHGADVTRPELWSDEPTRRLAERMLIATTDAQGVALFPHLPAGPAFGVWRVLLGPHAILLTLSERGDERARVDLAARATTTLHGRLTDERGRPVQGAEVSARWWRLEFLDSPDLPRCTSDDEGRYRLEGVGLERDHACLRVLHDGYLPAIERPRRIFEGPLVEWDVTLWRLAPISGRLITPGGEPVSGLVVEARRPGRLTGVDSSISAADGSFAFAPQVAGPYVLVPRDPSGRRGLISNGDTFAAAGEEDVQIPVIVHEPGSASVRLDFVEQGGDEPVDPSYVRLVPFGATQHDRGGFWGSSAGGSVMFPTVPRGEWVLIAGGDGLHPEHVQVSVGAAPRRVLVPMHYPQTAPLAGRLVYPQGATPPPAWVRAEWSPGEGLGAQHYGWVQVGPGRRFDLGALYEGMITLHLAADGWLGRARFELGPLGNDVVVLEARQGAQVEFVPDDYTPAARFVLEVAADGEPWRTLAERSTSDGRRDLFRVTLAPGDWRWRMRIERASRRGMTRLADLPSGRVVVVAGHPATVTVPVDLPAYP